MASPSRYYSNVAVANTLGASLSNSATSCYFTTAPVGYPTSFPFTLCLDPGDSSQELVSVTSGSGTSGTPYQITRGFDGTTAVSHNSGAAVQHEFSAYDVSTSRSHEASGSGSGVHGLPSSAWASAPIAVINETILSNSTTATQTWSSIPATYSHLLIVVSGRLTETTELVDWVTCQFNGDSSSVYGYVNLQCTNNTGSLAAPADGTGYAGSSFPLFRLTASEAGAAANAGGGWAIVPNYSAAVFNKTAYAVTGGGDGSTSLADGQVVWGFYNPSSQAAVTEVSLSCPASCFFKTGTFLGLYGFGG